ncbi:hypothetical protein, partial [Thiolapillus sp.]
TICRTPDGEPRRLDLATPSDGLCSTIGAAGVHPQAGKRQAQACLRPRDRFWDIPVPKIDSAFDNLFVPQPSWSPSTTQQLRKLVAAPYLAPNDWTPRSEAYFVFPLAQGTPGKQCGLAATGVYQPSLRSPWLAAAAPWDSRAGGQAGTSRPEQDPGGDLRRGLRGRFLRIPPGP